MELINYPCGGQKVVQIIPAPEGLYANCIWKKAPDGKALDKTKERIVCLALTKEREVYMVEPMIISGYGIDFIEAIDFELYFKEVHKSC